MTPSELYAELDARLERIKLGLTLHESEREFIEELWSCFDADNWVDADSHISEDQHEKLVTEAIEEAHEEKDREIEELKARIEELEDACSLDPKPKKYGPLKRIK